GGQNLRNFAPCSLRDRSNRQYRTTKSTAVALFKGSYHARNESYGIRNRRVQFGAGGVRKRVSCFRSNRHLDERYGPWRHRNQALRRRALRQRRLGEE